MKKEALKKFFRPDLGMILIILSLFLVAMDWKNIRQSTLPFRCDSLSFKNDQLVFQSDSSANSKLFKKWLQLNADTIQYKDSSDYYNFSARFNRFFDRAKDLKAECFLHSEPYHKNVMIKSRLDSLSIEYKWKQFNLNQSYTEEIKKINESYY